MLLGLVLGLTAAIASSDLKPTTEAAAPNAAASPGASTGPSGGVANTAPPSRTAGDPQRGTAPQPGLRRCEPELFRIARSTNANEVVYSARLAVEGGLEKEEPLEAEWQMLAEDGHREGLNFVERLLAYGFTVETEPEGDGYVVFLKAKKDRPVHLAMRDGCPRALVTIAGKPALLRRIFVQASSGGLLPGVAWADVYGVDPSSGQTLRERVFPKGSAGTSPAYLGPKGHLP